ncbi:Bacterial Ig-like domain (group 4) [compost metagenome]
MDAAQVEQIGDFTVQGFVSGTTLVAQATVWVRGPDAVQINTIADTAVSTAVGTAPVLPASVTVQYNDGSQQSGIAVTWDAVEPGKYAKDGTFEVTGAVEGTDKRARATVTVGTGEGQPEPDVAVTVTARSQCVGKVAGLTVRVVNDEVTTPFGAKTFAGVAPGKSASQTFSARKDAFEAGTVSVVATATVDGAQVTTEVEQAFDAVSCG